MKTSTALCGLMSGLLALVAATTTSSGAITLFSGTGQDILNASNTSFPTRTTSLTGTSLDFGSGASQDELLVEMQLFSAGTFSGATAPVVITIDTNLTRLAGSIAPEDWDPTMGISDGSTFVGAFNNDFGGVQSNAVEAGVTGTNYTSPSYTNLFTGATYPAIGGTIDFQHTITLESLLSNVEVWGGQSGNADVGAVDRSAQLDFVFAGNDAAENYRINTLTITANIPEPSRALLSLVGIAAIGLRRRRS